MSTTIIESGWITNEQGEKFAPKTLASKVITNDGTSIDQRILPTPTVNDNGKFLQVINGMWTAVEIPLAKGESF